MMDLFHLFPVLSMVCCGILHTVSSAPTGGPPERHVRTKRCSCASFLDKECVYFCHLDIIWVNTPERVVSYGLGNVPRRRRAAPEPVPAPARESRCKCLRMDDNTCASFCQPEHNPSFKTPSEEAILSPGARGCRHKLARSAGRIQRRKDSQPTAVAVPSALRAALNTRLLLEKWRLRQRHKGRAWEGESRAS